MAVEGRRKAVMDLGDWVCLVLLWGLALLVYVVSGLAFYAGIWVAGLFGVVCGIAMTYVSIETTKMLWRLKNEAQD